MSKSSQACDHCHKRRIKCQFEPAVNKCLNCYKLSTNCTFHRVPQKRGPHRKVKSLDHTNTPLYSSNRAHSVSTSIDTVQHSLQDTLSLYYSHIHPRLSILPLDSPTEFDNVIVANISQYNLKHLFHAILENCLNNSSSNNTTTLVSHWNQLVLLQYEHTPTNHCIYILCHLLLCLFLYCSLNSSMRISKIIGHCIGTFIDIKHTLPPNINHRLASLIKLLDLINVRFYSKDAMFLCNTATQDSTNIDELITLLQNGNASLQNGNLLNPIWYKYQSIVSAQSLFTQQCLVEIDYTQLINKLCALINAMLHTLLHIDENKYTTSLLQLLKHNNTVYEFGLNLIINKINQILNIIKDTPSFLINMLILSSPSSQDNNLVAQLSNSMNELVQITTLTYKLGQPTLQQDQIAALTDVAADLFDPTTAADPTTIAAASNNHIMFDFQANNSTFNNTSASHESPTNTLYHLAQLLQAL